MPRATEHEAKLGASAKQVAEHASALARLEVELATLEVKRKIASLGLGVAFGAATVLLLLYALGFGLAAGAAGIATELPVWAALLIVTGVLVILVALFGALAAVSIKRGAPPVPDQAIREAKLTSETLRHDGRQ
ncbi:MAG TPA: phage holin family protein [Gaiellaceae bacterium]|nr:phage holin family protein [Gaiellaceae bacterium]